MLKVNPNLLTALVLSATIVLALPDKVIREPIFPKAEPRPAPQAHSQLGTAPDLRQLFESASRGDPTPNRTQQVIEREQIQEALQLVRHADPAQRQIGMEQMAAYPSMESERALLKGAHDLDDSVSKAAFSSLAQLSAPSRGLITELLKMARQGQKFQADYALETLSQYLSVLASDQPARQQIHRGIRQLKLNKSLPQARQQMIVEIFGEDPLLDLSETP